MIPISATDFLRERSPRKAVGNSFAHVNRFSHLRSASPAVSESGLSRNRSTSVKRKPDDNNSYANAAKRFVPPSVDPRSDTAPDYSPALSEIDLIELNIAKARSICEKVETALTQSEIDPALISIFGDIIAVLALTAKSHESICMVNKMVISTARPPPRTKHFRSGAVQLRAPPS